MHIDKNIKFLRKKLGLTQSDIAEQLGKTVTVVGGYERGKIVPPLEVSLQLCDIFQVSLDDLVTKDLSKEGLGRPESQAPRRELKPTADDGELLIRQLLVQKLIEVATRLRETQPELYEELRLDELIEREKKIL